jgi:hypothetical protein
MTPQEELTFWREMARAQRLQGDRASVWWLERFCVQPRFPSGYSVVMEAARRDGGVPSEGPLTDVFIQHQITRLEREIGSEK